MERGGRPAVTARWSVDPVASYDQSNTQGGNVVGSQISSCIAMVGVVSSWYWCRRVKWSTIKTRYIFVLFLTPAAMIITSQLHLLRPMLKEHEAIGMIAASLAFTASMLGVITANSETFKQFLARRRRSSADSWSHLRSSVKVGDQK